MAQHAKASAGDLRLAANRIGILNSATVQMRRTNRAASEKVSQRPSDIALAVVAARLQLARANHAGVCRAALVARAAAAVRASKRRAVRASHICKVAARLAGDETQATDAATPNYASIG